MEGTLLHWVALLSLMTFMLLAPEAEGAEPDVTWSTPRDGQAPDSAAFLSMRVANMAQCKTLCVRTSSCLAVHFRSRDRQCQLFSDGEELESSFLPSPGSVYVSRQESGADSSSCAEGFVSLSLDSQSQNLVCVPVVTCDPPPPLSVHVLVNQTGSHVGDTADVACAENYTFVGTNNQVTCTLSSQWSEPLGSCEVVTCEPPPPPSVHFLVNQTGSHVGDTADVACAEGYTFVGTNNQVTCTLSSQWTEPLGSCEVDCGPAPSFPGGRALDVSGTTENSTASFRCGPVTVHYVCTAAGVWQHSGNTADYISGAGTDTLWLMSGHKANWTDARDQCETLCGQLASLDTPAKYNFINTLRNGEIMFVGGSRANGTYLWLNGEPVNDQFWIPGEPNDHGPSMCLQLYQSGLDNTECQFLGRFICSASFPEQFGNAVVNSSTG